MATNKNGLFSKSQGTNFLLPSNREKNLQMQEITCLALIV